MKLVSFGSAGLEQPGLLTDTGIVPFLELGDDLPKLISKALSAEAQEELQRRLENYDGDRIPVDQVRLGPPIVDPGKIICIGLNYRGHATEQGLDWPKQPLLFGKAPTTLAGCKDPIVLPKEDACVDYEVELAVVIGKKARSVSADKAMDIIAGYMVAHDVSARRWQKADGQWFRAKSCDTFFPCGPSLVTADEIPDYRQLHLTTTIRGEVVQDALADDLIHDIPALIEAISADMTLMPGDIISTGTPAGVGCYRDPKLFLQEGDVVTCAISGLGELVNPVQAAS